MTDDTVSREELIRRLNAAEALLAAVSEGQIDTIHLGDQTLVIRLRETQDALDLVQRAADFSTDGLAVIDSDYRYLYANPAVAERFNSVPSGIIGRTMPELLGAATFQNSIKPHLDRALAGESVVYGDWFVFRDGTKRYLQIAYSPLQSKDQDVAGVVVSTRDDTRHQRAVERERHLTSVVQAIRNVNQLIARVSEPSELIQKTCVSLIETRGYFSAWIAVTEEETGPLVASAGLDDDADFRALLSKGILPNCVQRVSEADKKVAIINNTTDRCTRCPLAKRYDGRTALVAELIHQGCSWGFVGVSVPSAFVDDEEEGALFIEVASDIALALSKLESERKLHLQAMILDAIRDQVTVTDVDGRIVYVNKAVADLLKRSRDELIGRPIETYGEDPSRGARQREIVERTVSEGQWRGEIINIAKDGSEAILDCRTWLISDEGGSGRFLGGVARDITERKAIEKELAESHHLYTALVELAPVGILVHQDERLVFVNRFYASMMGAKDPSELLGRNIWDTVVESEHLKIRELVRQRLETGKAVSVETRHKRLDGEEIDVRVIGLPVEFAGRPATQVICEDIREYKRIEGRLRQMQKMEAIGQLTGGVAHDFNNLLQVILTNLELAQLDNPKSKTADDLIDRAIKAGKRGARLTQQLLAFSRKQTLQPHEVDIRSVVEQTLGLLQPTLGENIRIQASLGSVPMLARIDESGLQNAIINLALNSRAAMPNGGSIGITTGLRDFAGPILLEDETLLAGRYVEVEISDTGVGMSEAVLKRAFEPFFTTREIGQGSGLGLSMVYGFARQSGGFVELESRVGKGTKARIILPFVAKN